jgi:hypothetical protein
VNMMYLLVDFIVLRVMIRYHIRACTIEPSQQAISKYRSAKS